MIPKILVYLENGPLHFGISKYIRENLQSELFAIINTNKGKRFYQEQDLVKFNKYWFLRDNLKDIKKTPDLVYLKKFEEKYKIELMKAIYSDAIFLDYNKYHTFTYEEILNSIEQICRFYEKILDEIKPDFLIIRVTDAIADHLLHLMCKSRKIKILILNFSRFGYRSFISNEVDILDFDAFTNYEEIEHSNAELIKFVKGYSKQQNLMRNKFRNSFLSWLKASFYFFKLISKKSYQEYYAHLGRSPFKVILNEVSFKIFRIKREKFLNNNAAQNLEKNEKFVYFALGVDPERSTLIPTPFFNNQLEIIKNIAKSLPIEYQLYVKEHPMQKIWAWRDISFYKEILDLPNVKLIHPSLNNEVLFKNCSLVISIVGTTALEATIYNKPSMVFGEVLFSSLPSVYRARNFEELPELIKTALKSQVNFHDLNKFVNIVLSNSFEYDDHKLLVDLNHQIFFNGYLFDVDIKVEKMKEVLEKNKETIDLVALQYLKKIKKYLKNKKLE